VLEMPAHFARDEEGGWNRKIRRASKPAKYAPTKGATARPRQPDDFPAARQSQNK
jgi:hypothetical protein